MSDKPDHDRAEEKEILEARERATPVRAQRGSHPRTSVLSIRISQELLRDLTELAKKRGETAGTFARSLLEQGVAAEELTPAALARVFNRWVDELARSASQLELRWSDALLREGSWADAFVGLGQDARAHAHRELRSGDQPTHTPRQHTSTSSAQEKVA